MIKCLQQAGIVFEFSEDQKNVVVKNSFPACEQFENKVIEMFSGDGGTTNRFLLSFLSRGRNRYRLLTSGRIVARPFEELIDLLRSLGVDIEVGHLDGNFYFEVQGPYQFNQKEIHVKCDKTTQFASGLMLSLNDLLEARKSAIVPVEISSSEKYLTLTRQLLNEFKESNQFEIPPDFSAMAYFIAIGATISDLVITNCHKIDSYQADSYFLQVLKKMKGEYFFSQRGLEIKRSNLQAINFDCRLAPDLAPAFCYLATCAKGLSILENVEVLKYKESDRLEEIQKILTLFGCEFSYNENNSALEIVGSDKIFRHKIKYTAQNDHRMIMLAAILMKRHGGGEIVNHRYVEKSFSNFFEQLI